MSTLQRYRARCDAATREARRRDPAVVYVLVPCRNDREFEARLMLCHMRSYPWEYGWRGALMAIMNAMAAPIVYVALAWYAVTD